MRLTPDEFEAERRYQGLMHFVKQMHRDGLITDCEFEQISADYAARLSPKTGSLLARNELLCVQNRANIEPGKEGEKP